MRKRLLYSVAALLVVQLAFALPASGGEKAAPIPTQTGPNTPVSNVSVLPGEILATGSKVTQSGAESGSYMGTNERASLARTMTEAELAIDSQAQPVNPRRTGTDTDTSTDIGIESVIGTDSRVQVTDTTAWPYRAIAYISFQQGGSSYRCTGWLIGADTVATAGHCVHSGGSGGVWSTNVVVYPGRNGSTLPYGSCTAKSLHSVSGWTTSGNSEYDYGGIKLNCTVGNTTGFFGFYYTTTSRIGVAETVSGYPGDKSGYTQWRHADSIKRESANKLWYSNDTAGGQSGAPVYHNWSPTCTTCGMAIHAYGVDSTGYNSGTRINQTVYNNLLSWKNL